MKKYFTLFIFLSIFSASSRAEEGMWIPMLLERLNFNRMQDLGLKLSAEDIYSVNHSSLKDAIVQFGGGCTADIISPQGLILTNHHCGLGAIQRLSSLTNDYITNGYWAKSFEEELPCPGLSVTLLVRMEEVTAKVLEGISNGMNQFQRSQIIRANSEKLEQEAVSGTHFEARVRSFFYGNQFYLIVNEVFRDVRLVGAPPSCIGNFGGDTDNWMWPRHTGDFSIFRIYAGKNNEPAPYAADNKPYIPKKHLAISLKGYRQGDFTFVFGYPGATREYLTSYGVDLTVSKENPLRIRLRQKKLDIMKAAMAEDRLVRIQYTAKASGVANYWKKMIGESRGIRRAGAVAIKEQLEQDFQAWVDSAAERKARYGGLLKAFSETCQQNLEVDMASILIAEAGMGIEVVRFSSGFRELAAACAKKDPDQAEVDRILEKLKTGARDFYGNYQPEIDRQVMAAMLKEMAATIGPRYCPDIFPEITRTCQNDFDAYAEDLFSASLFTDTARFRKYFASFRPSRIRTMEKDPVYLLMKSIYDRNEKDIAPAMKRFSERTDSLQRIYMAGMMEMQQNRVFYPDANSTMRVAYGRVEDYSPADAVRYNFFTTLNGVIEKEDPGIHDYRVDPDLKRLWAEKDFGIYADSDGAMHVAFTASNHTTGGNSGSPVLNAEGQLIGINFDRNWEGTLSDLMYDPSQCRNIALDIRYCLFIIDRIGDCKRLISEMEIVQR